MDSSELTHRQVVTALELRFGVEIHNWTYDNWKGLGLDVPGHSVLFASKYYDLRQHERAKVIEMGARAYFWEDVHVTSNTTWFDTEARYHFKVVAVFDDDQIQLGVDCICGQCDDAPLFFPLDKFKQAVRSGLFVRQYRR